ncbi:arginine N-succinyltransferase [Kushneria phosphatilytica]|uniref:Arginine N-succinyltransferase n=1 Tax=Kushneria phosphatilytica TaxID=657387 RepID=A0A1S1NRC1_9GAMM|nr:arginine N-succinyltransferase [Kushneria phosphatilytica]OHV07117.1 arginine N-succinyltransferase [Kushneria phosphatilytica]QEL10327.1 arginine N-succinyltransferase [Kushneria phosphatilytica]
MLMRPIEFEDLDALQAIAVETGVGFTSLPDNREFLEARIAETREAFDTRDGDPELATAPANYFFVLEDDDLPTGVPRAERIAGCCAIEARVGLDVPFYNYRVGRLAQASRQLDLHRTVDTLFLSSDHTGDAEVCSLYLRPQWREKGARNATLLSRMRWLFMATWRERFPDRVLAEMRGRFDDQGRSPFWESLGRHFFPIDFRHADRLTGLGQKSFIGELMPRYPICTALLPDSARACIGQVHDQTRPALAMLNAQGLRFEGYIDIFDAGPTVEAYLDDVRAVRHSRELEAVISDRAESPGAPRVLASTTQQCATFRACWVGREVEEDRLILHPDEARRLGVESGERLRVLAD